MGKKTLDVLKTKGGKWPTAFLVWWDYYLYILWMKMHFSPKESCFAKSVTAPSAVEAKGRSAEAAALGQSLLQSHQRSWFHDLWSDSLSRVWLCIEFSFFDEVLLPCILNLMCFILSDSRMHNFSLEVWLSKETCHYHLCFVPGALDWVLCLEENYTQHYFDWSHVNVIMEIWNLFLQHFSAFPFVLQVSVLFLNTGPNLSVSVFYFIVNYECSIRELEEKMRTSLYALLETRNASSTPELFWIG